MTRRALFWFEVRRLRAALVGVAAWALLGPLAVTSLLGRGDPRAPEALALGTAAVLLALAHALLERDALSRALPVRPGAVHTARVAVLVAAALGATLLQWTAAVAQQALHGPWPRGLLEEVLAPQGLAVAGQALVCAGLASGLVACGAASAWVGGLAVLLVRVLRPEADLLRFDAPGPWALAAGLALLAGRAWFVAPRDVVARAAQGLRRGPLGRPLARCAGLLAGAALIGLPLSFLRAAPPPRPAFPADVVHVTTPAYRLRFPARQQRAARALLADAPAIHARVAADLKVDAQVEVRLGDGPEAAVDLRGDARYGLARVTAEALLARRAAGRPALDVARAGLVRHLALRASGRDAFGSRFHAAVLHARRRVDLSEVFDRAVLERWRGPEATPAVGAAVWIALEAALGAGAGERFLRAAEALPPELADDAVWPRLLARLGLEREALRAGLMDVLEDDAIRNDPRAHVPLPRLRVLLDVQDRPLGWRILAIPDVDIPSGWRVVCRVRTAPPDQPESRALRALPVGRDERGVPTFFVEEPRVAGDRRAVPAPWIQVGIRPLDLARVEAGIWEDWTPPAGPP